MRPGRKNPYWHGIVTKRKCFIALLVTCSILMLGIYELFNTMTCDVVEMTKYITTPEGKSIQKVGKFYGLRQYYDLDSTCGYNKKGKIECPDVRMQGESVIRQIQLLITRMLIVLDAICQKHNISYWIASGTLVGAIRDKGFVPWDNDADVGMLRNDYEKFRVACAKDLPEDIFLQDRDSDPYYHVMQRNEAKLRDLTTCYGLCLRYGCKHRDGVMIDLFIFENTSNPEIYKSKFKRFEYTHEELFPVRELKFEGYTVKAPHQYEKIMSREFGNVSEFPPDYQLCPSKGYIGYPWKSCEDIATMSIADQKRIIAESRISKDWILYYLY